MINADQRQNADGIFTNDSGTLRPPGKSGQSGRNSPSEGYDKTFAKYFERGHPVPTITYSKASYK